MKIKPSTLIIIIASVLVVAVGITLAVVLTREEPAPVEPIEPVDPDAVIGTLIYHLHGEATHTVKVTKGEPFEFYTPDPRYGYTFVGWALEGEYNRAITKEYVENFDFESILRLYAIWNANDAITITFNSMGGSVVANHSHLKGDPLGLLLENSTRDGYTFMGWYEDETCNIPYNRDVARTADITLYAKWLKIEITDETVTVHFSNTGDSAPAPVTLRLGATFSDPLPAVQQLGYIFAGWYLDTGYTMPFNITTPITTNMTLFARWTKTQNQYVLTFDTQGGTPVPPISNTEVFYVEALELPTTSRDG